MLPVAKKLCVCVCLQTRYVPLGQFVPALLSHWELPREGLDLLERVGWSARFERSSIRRTEECSRQALREREQSLPVRSAGRRK
jgi:hypothetical protein